MKKALLLLFPLFCFTSGLFAQVIDSTDYDEKNIQPLAEMMPEFPGNYAIYVDPIIGTNGMGHTFPGACYPFGAIQLSPDTDTIPHNINGQYQPHAYDYCAGYQHKDSTIVGFSHTHFSGTEHSAMGFYPVCPSSGQYVIGAPYLPEIMLNLPNGKTLVIIAPKVSDENCYIQSIKLNGKPLHKCYITYEQITEGGMLLFEMGSTPNPEWFTEKPYSLE